MNIFLENATKILREAYGNFSSEEYDGLFEEFLNPDHILESTIVLETKNGKRELPAYRSQFSNILGPYKGGIRFHENVTKEEVIALSALMSIKTSLLGLPLGGGKGGVAINPKELSRDELQELSRAYVRCFYKDFGPTKDVPAPDVNTDPQIMAWMIDEYETLVGQCAPGTFTGKPVSIGGSKGRSNATSMGGLIALTTYLRHRGETLADRTISIQGAGNVGLHFANLALAEGAKIVSISDSRSYIHQPEGLDMELVTQLKSEGKPLSACGNAKVITKEEFFALDVDILVPAALENQITEENADSIRAKLILELANGPTTKGGDDILNAKGIDVIPDVLANAGGVTVSYFEQVQNSMNFYWEEQEVYEKLQKLMAQATDNVLFVNKQQEVSLRKSALILGLKSILDATRLKRR